VDVEAIYDEEHGEILVYRNWKVVEQVTDERSEMALHEARLYEPGVEVGGVLGLSLDLTQFEGLDTRPFGAR